MTNSDTSDLYNNQKNIVFVITKSEVGGAQTWVSQLKFILEEKHNIFLITSETGWLTDFFEPEKVKIVPGLVSMLKPGAIFKISSALKEFNADLVISNSATAGLYSRLAKLFYRHKHIYVSHGWSCIYNGGRFEKIFCLIERFLSLLTNKVLCVSINDQYNATHVIGINADKTVVIRNSINPMEKKNFINKKFKILFVGRMSYPKRPDLLAEAAVYFPDVVFDFVGGGPLLSELKKKYQSSPNIRFLGEIGSFKNFKDYELFVLASESEGLPMSALEAGTAGLPLLLSDVGGCNELILESITGDKNGLLFNNKLSELVSQIREIINNYELFYYAANDISDKFDINKHKDYYYQLIDNLC